jgi:hypothetical protein
MCVIVDVSTVIRSCSVRGALDKVPHNTPIKLCQVTNKLENVTDVCAQALCVYNTKMLYFSRT